MRYVAAYCLAVLGGNQSPTAKDIKAILGSVGIDAVDDQVNKVINELKGKDLEEVIAAGKEKLATMPAGGAVVAGGAAPAAGGEAPAAAEEKKEEKKPESEEESDDDMGFGLFD